MDTDTRRERAVNIQHQRNELIAKFIKDFKFPNPVINLNYDPIAKAMNNLSLCIFGSTLAILLFLAVKF